jgi:hypothetical protein
VCARVSSCERVLGLMNHKYNNEYSILMIDKLSSLIYVQIITGMPPEPCIDDYHDGTVVLVLLQFMHSSMMRNRGCSRNTFVNSIK